SNSHTCGIRIKLLEQSFFVVLLRHLNRGKQKAFNSLDLFIRGSAVGHSTLSKFFNEAVWNYSGKTTEFINQHLLCYYNVGYIPPNVISEPGRNFQEFFPGCFF